MDSNLAITITKRIDKIRTAAELDFRQVARAIYYPDGAPIPVSPFKTREAVRVAENNARKFLEDSVADVLVISKETQILVLINDAVFTHLSNLERIIEGGFGFPLSAATLDVAARRFETVRNVSIQSLKNHRPKFEGMKNKGGAKPIWDWEGVKIYINEQFPNGIPKVPKMNAKIALMMAEWFQKTVADKPVTQCEKSTHYV